ncbi:hypothetical protein BJ165DRAFT_1464768 [Panaeolus papilionaceus]|nr:hypothetical protein BJ165DRAFT_1464768 [Panaeolus papilionaceus]
MSYASVAAHNAPPPSQQPQPDPALLNVTPPTSTSQINTSSKVNLVAPDFKEQLESDDSDASHPSAPSTGVPRSSKVESRNRQHSQKSAPTAMTREKCIGGLVGIVNVGIFGLLGRTFFLRPQLQKDVTAILTSVGGSIALLTAQSHLLNSLGIQRLQVKNNLATPLSAFLIRPLTHKHITGLNSVILGVSIGIASCTNWSRPTGKKLISALLTGLLALWGVESYAIQLQEGH